MNPVGDAAGRDIDGQQEAAAVLRSTDTVRARARWLLQRARAGESRWFRIHDPALGTAADEVAAITRARYPDLDIGYHSRWRHFEAGGVDRNAALNARLAGSDPAARARAMIDLAVVSVLTDAGAGPGWSYREQPGGQRFGRSEGLAVAGWHAFCAGLFSSDPARPLRADAEGLCRLTPERLGAAFQAGPGNPLIGLRGRTQLLRRLGETLRIRADVFGPERRPGGLLDHLASGSLTVSVRDVLSAVLSSLSAIWPTDNVVGTVPLGDCWTHAAVPGPGLTRGWVPFHKLSQWLSYSLLEPLESAGLEVVDVDALTALARVPQRRPAARHRHRAAA